MGRRIGIPPSLVVWSVLRLTSVWGANLLASFHVLQYSPCRYDDDAALVRLDNYAQASKSAGFVSPNQICKFGSAYSIDGNYGDSADQQYCKGYVGIFSYCPKCYWHI